MVAPVVAAALIQAIPQVIGMFNQGDDSSPEQLPTMNPEQERLLSMLTGMAQSQGGGATQGMGLLQQYMDPSSDVYRNFEAPYMRQFQQQTIPQLAEQFGGFGANSGALSSSGFGQALGAAGANLQTNLAQMKSGMQRNAINDYLSNFLQSIGMSLGKEPFAYHQQDKGGGFMQGFGAGASGGMDKVLAALAGQIGGGSSGGAYQAQYPLSNTYGDMFKTGYADYAGL